MAKHEGALRFGAFIPPHHKVGLDPTIGLENDLTLIEHLDRLGYAEAWIGEHHSSGVETIASPEIMIAVASQRTRHIKLGTGVSSLPYHHPFVLADRIVQLDHVTRGRTMFGVGPGQLLQDATMLGIEPSTQRPRMEEALDVMLRLFAGETVTEKTDWFTCQDAVLQLKPYSDFDIAVAGAISPSGPRLAGKHGVGLLSLAASDPTGTERLAEHWSIVESEATAAGHAVSRENWRLLGPMHVAETREQARKDMEYGLCWLMESLSQVTMSGLDRFDDVDHIIDYLNETGRGSIGTPDMAAAHVQRMLDASGGFGCFLFRDSDFAAFPAKLRSYQLFAEEVAPRFTGQLAATQASNQRVKDSGGAGAVATQRSQEEAAARYAAQQRG
ncbi:monooxygenase (plasmid) [Pseudonocardia sp. EC080610-09]|uniref:LLM class flavin-dependent oxidoreductase n=1 Tax=unclassified Pseudonocardia TaxID=2619320 RepID=UPI000706E9D0|nr:MULTISPECIES: LLM class flavin-dependent oxidoreductase [unclassified Pseudonocardia]ALL79234.1 monooxygenase [Pseudonocardia sp. EC080610-09]ALL79769.1 monooxygenase [Pseudonocardia sp. EC080610-09]ALL85205.1 monooxygenase [Pseudonocardia sp. EC080619-01]